MSSNSLSLILNNHVPDKVILKNLSPAFVESQLKPLLSDNIVKPSRPVVKTPDPFTPDYEKYHALRRAFERANKFRIKKTKRCARLGCQYPRHSVVERMLCRGDANHRQTL